MDPEVLNPTEYEYYKQTNPPKYSDYTHRTPEEIASDLIVAHTNLKRQQFVNTKLVDSLRQLTRQNDRRIGEVAQLKRQVHRGEVRVKALMGAIGVTWTVIGILLKVGLPLILKGLAK